MNTMKKCKICEVNIATHTILAKSTHYIEILHYCATHAQELFGTSNPVLGNYAKKFFITYELKRIILSGIDETIKYKPKELKL